MAAEIGRFRFTASLIREGPNVKKLVTILTIATSITLAGHARATTVDILEFTPTFVPGEPISSFGSNPNLDADLANQQSILDTFFASRGVKAKNIPTSFTASDLVGAQLTIINRPSSVPSALQLTALNDYVLGGGRLLLNSEHAALSALARIDEVNAILSALGSSISNKATFFDNDFHVTTNIFPDPFTTGVHSILYAATSSLTGGIELVAGASGQDFIAREGLGSGQLFVIADSNTVDALAFSDPAFFDNAQLYLNFVGAEDLNPVPEPTTLLLFGTAAAGLGLVRWRRRSHS
jgi:hypothetical protein